LPLTLSAGWGKREDGLVRIGGSTRNAPNAKGTGEMGLFDKAKDALSEHSEHVDTAIEKSGDFVDDRTGDKYVEQVDKGQDFAADRYQEYVGEDQPEQPA
jgi:hypothetical protein